MHRAMTAPGQFISLNGFPPTNGQCWVPPGAQGPEGHWVTAVDPMCTFQPPAGTTPTGTITPTGTAGGWWASIPTWLKVVGVAAIGFVGYQIFIAPPAAKRAA